MSRGDRFDGNGIVAVGLNQFCHYAINLTEFDRLLPQLTCDVAPIRVRFEVKKWQVYHIQISPLARWIYLSKPRVPNLKLHGVIYHVRYRTNSEISLTEKRL